MILESTTPKTTFTVEASASTLMASSTSDTLTMVMLPLATSSASPGVVSLEWVSFMRNMARFAAEALGITWLALPKSSIIDFVAA